MPWPDCAPSHSLPDGGGGNQPPSGQPNVPANSRQSGLRVPLAASSPRYLALTNIRRRSQSLPAATEDRHRPPSTPNRARTITLPCPYRPFRCCIVIPSVDLGLESDRRISTSPLCELPGRSVAQGTVGTDGIVVIPPSVHDPASCGIAPEPVPVQALVPEPSVETLDGRVLHWFARSDEVQAHPVLVGPCSPALSPQTRVHYRPR